MNKEETLKQICKMISSGEIPDEVYNKYLSKTPIGFMNKTDLYNFLKGGRSDTNREVQLICRIGEDKYQKHFLYIADETTYVVEQLEYSDVSRYDYEFIFRPEAIVPIEIKTQVGDN